MIRIPRSPLWLATALALGAPAALAGGPVTDPGPLANTPADVRTDQLIIKYRDASELQSLPGGASVQRARALPEQTLAERVAQVQAVVRGSGRGLKLLRQTGQGAHVFKLDRAQGSRELAALADAIRAADPSIEYVEPDRLLQAMLTPNDTDYSKQWDLSEPTGGIRAPQAWDLATGSGVVVAVIDTGYRPHADLSGQIVAGYDMITNATTARDGNGRDGDAADEGDWQASGDCPSDPSPSNSSWHGTHVAGTIAAKTNNALGVAGIAFNAKVQPVRVLGRCGGYMSDISDAVVWASGGTVSGVPANATPAKVLNLSLGGGGSCGSTMQAAVSGARSRGAVVVVAAGNSNTNASNFTPANCTGVITVAATDRYGARAPYSNYGNVVALAAPGGAMGSTASNGIYSTLNAGTTTPGADSYAYYQGTSMAAPHVAGVAALMFSVKPTATPDEIAQALTSSARTFPGSCTGCGAGIVDAYAAVQAIQGGPSTPDEVEPNDSLATANLVAAPKALKAQLGSSSDTDYFRVNLPAGKTLSAVLSMPNGTTDYDLTLRNSAGTAIKVSEKPAGQTDSVSQANSSGATQTYYVQVRYYSGSTGQNYTLNLSW
ncbi:S8 family serine peptidase [Pelomonas sp. CA6]|uniref:S8 family peptidase n=1 Tax=Pelomonas sp. CA6 TaxID=2907999 RepID=UPI001F4C1C0D|nr:S8 family peptidase [Pelomonas sp. CA6]MCH7343690.1 S8 family serine peptidase [Pelomonas sp. CA6]